LESPEYLLCPFCSAPYREFIPPGTVQVKCPYCGSTILVPPKFGGPVQRCPNHSESLAIGLCSKCYGSFCGDCLFLITSVKMVGKSVIIDRLFLCAKCRDGAKDGEKGTLIANTIWLLIFSSLILYAFSWQYGGWLLNIILVLLPLFIALAYWRLKAIDERYKMAPSLRKFREVSLKLNDKIESLKATLTAEELYHKIIGGKWTRLEVGYKPFVEKRLEEYMKSGLDRKEALLKIMSEDGLEIAPGLHIPLRLDDILHEIEREFKLERRKQKFFAKSS